ncbi:MAG: methionyl-tRNA formyltransferase [Alphaproteobacteria bacterium]|nr:MAG: methionyl-tRNA formyltransferase [Alphaproteobacteria bacterium]
MKIGYFADGPWSHKALEKIVGAPELEILYIVPRFDSQDPVLRQYAEKLDVPFLPLENVNSDTAVRKIKTLGADILVSMSFNQILKNDILNAAPMGFINCHAGKLPMYRGRNILNWALINGETSFGVTVHYVDEGIDTGDIILQREAPIGPDDTYGDILERAITLCADVLFEALIQLATGVAQRIPQNTIHPVGMYCSMRREGDEWINWSWPSVRIHNFVRGISLPGPCARTRLGEDVIKIIRTALIPDAPSYIGIEGAVVGITRDGPIVKTGDSTIQILEYDFVRPGHNRNKKLTIGKRLGS